MAEVSLSSVPEQQVVVANDTIDVDPEGDVYFVLPGKKFLISSKIVGNASRVLKAMLGPNFAEGKQVSSIQPGRVPLAEDDDPEVMTTIFNVIHHRPQSEPLNNQASFLEKLAFTCDKYDCTTALSSWSSLLLGALMNDPYLSCWPNFDEDGQILLAAYLFDDCRGFRQITKRMIYNPTFQSGFCHALGPKPFGLSKDVQARLPTGLISVFCTSSSPIKRS